MSVTMTKSEGVTVFAMTSKQDSKWPLICQILGTMCYTPICCVSHRLRRTQASSLSALGTIQIMVGLLNIGLGPIISNGNWHLRAAPYWLGGVFTAFGVLCILAEKFPSPCLVGINVLVNLAGVGMAITAIVLYAIDLSSQNKLYWSCNNYYYYRETPPPRDENCLQLKQMTLWLLNGIDVVLIVLAVLQLCVTISSVVLSIKALCKYGKEGKENTQDVEQYDVLLEGK